MSDSLKRKIHTYPNQRVYNKVHEIAKKQGTSVSKVVQEALKEYIDKN